MLRYSALRRTAGNWLTDYQSLSFSDYYRRLSFTAKPTLFQRVIPLPEVVWCPRGDSETGIRRHKL